MEDTRQSWLGGILVVAQEGYLGVVTFSRLRATGHLFADEEWCCSQAFAAAARAWLRSRQQPPLSLTSFRVQHG